MVTEPAGEVTVITPLSTLRPCLAIALGMHIGRRKGRHKGQKHGEKAEGVHGDPVLEDGVGWSGLRRLGERGVEEFHADEFTRSQRDFYNPDSRTFIGCSRRYIAIGPKDIGEDLGKSEKVNRKTGSLDIYRSKSEQSDTRDNVGGAE